MDVRFDEFLQTLPENGQGDAFFQQRVVVNEGRTPVFVFLVLISQPQISIDVGFMPSGIDDAGDDVDFLFLTDHDGFSDRRGIAEIFPGEGAGLARRRSADPARRSDRLRRSDRKRPRKSGIGIKGVRLFETLSADINLHFGRHVQPRGLFNFRKITGIVVKLGQPPGPCHRYS